MTYIPADMVTTNYGLSPETWDRIQETYRDHLEKHSICEICQSKPSVRITPLGKILAACLECVEQQRQEVIDEYNRLQEAEYDHPRYQGFNQYD